MFLELYELRKYKQTSSGKRDSYYYYNLLNTHFKFKNLTFKSKSKAGRNDSGAIVARTKSSLLIKNRSIRLNYNHRFIKFAFIASFNIIPFRNKIISLIYFSNGFFTYYSTGEDHKLFSFFFYSNHRKLKKFKIKSLFLLLFQIRKLSFISFLELKIGAGSQYVRSPGCKSKIIKFDKDVHSALIQLPSGLTKLFSNYSFVLLGRVANSQNIRYSNLTSGYWRSFGIKSIVRGVAKNPVDHPHGGRTKAIRYPRTPWGKTTKFK